MFTTNKNTFFNVYGEGLFRLESDTLFPIVTGFYTMHNEVIFSLPYSESRVIVGTDDNKLYTFDGIKYYNYDINDEGYLKESILADGQIISDTLYAFGTLYGGVEIVNKKTGKIVYTVNYQNGLPDDEIYSLGLDNNNGLWISHEYGLSRVDFNIPVRNYTTYPGLTGNLITSLMHNDTLYVGTNEGVYYLSEVKDYSEAEVWVKTHVRTTSAKTKSTLSETIQQEDKKPVKKLFSRLFSKDDDKEEETKKPKAEAEKPTVKTKYIKKTVSKLRSINYIFKKIDKLNEKCTQLISTENGILVATNTGLYVIEDLTPQKIISNKYINHISNKTKLNKYYIGTDNGMFCVRYDKENRWIVEQEFVDFKEPVYSINLLDNEIWIGSENKAYRFLIDSSTTPFSLKDFNIKTDFPEQYFLDFINDTIIAFLESGLYYYDIKLDSFRLYTNQENVTSGSKFIIQNQGYPSATRSRHANAVDAEHTTRNTHRPWPAMPVPG